MFKVFLVDDDPLILEALKLVIERIASEFKVAGTALNGAEAIEKIRGTEPDIVVTDIKMPMMDGIELMQQLQKSKTHIKVVILSAYREFEYAQQAIKFGASDYLLKPLTEVKVREVLRNVKELIEVERKKERQLADLHRVKDENIKLAGEDFFRKLLRSPVDQINLRERLPQFGLTMNSQRCQIFSLGVAVDKDHVNFVRAIEWTNDLLKGKGFAFDNSGNSLSEMVGLLEAELVKESLDTLLQNLLSFENSPSVIGISSEHDWEDLRIAYEEAAFSREYAAFTGPALVKFETIQHVQYLHQGDLFKSEEDLIQKVSLGLKEESLAILQQMFAKLHEDQNLNPEIIYKSCFEMIILLKRACGKLRKKEEVTSLLEMIDLDSLRRNINIQDLYRYLENLVTTVVEGIQNLRQEDDDRIIEKVMQYCRGNLDKDLTLDVIADYVCFNKNYFCSFYKRKTGVNFSDYLTGLRMEKAKELLGKTELKVNRVAELVGYKNASHFGKVFKDVVGITPAEYKETYQK
jgi:two-component system, response regulator YesN